MSMNRREFSKKLGMAGVLAPAAWGERRSEEPERFRASGADGAPASLPRERQAISAWKFHPVRLPG